MCFEKANELVDIARLLARGVGGWLQFERAARRTGLFSEKYLAHPIGQILGAHGGDRTRAEYRHPVLAKLATGPGRRPEIDFVVCTEYPRIALAVESKWIGSTKPSIQSVLWDLIRLELLCHHEGCRSFFVFGGKKSDLESFFEQTAFAGKASNTPSRPLLRHDRNGKHSTYIVPSNNPRIALLKELFTAYQTQEFAAKIHSRRTRPFPDPTPASSYQVYVWEIFSPKKRHTFTPGKSKHYRLAKEP